jgi:DNA modification methylase
MIDINKIYKGNCLDLFKELDNESIDCVITSPPYWQLRDYKWDGQWGLEPTFHLYLENLWAMMDEVYRVLKPTGTAWINLGDTYNTNSGRMGNVEKYGGSPKFTKGENDATDFKQSKNNKDAPTKCLLLIPHRFAIGCIDRGWIMRNDIVWAKRNGMPESVTDRFSKKHEYFFFMAKSEKYYFDLDGIRDKHKQVSIDRKQRGVSENNKWVNGADGSTPHNLSQPRKNTTKIPREGAEMFGSPRARQHRQGYSNAALGSPHQDTNGGFPTFNEKGKNPGSVSDFWDIPTQPSSDEHYAAYNDKLIGKPIVAGCPKDGIVLDPFCGTATTGCRALELGRNFIGFEGSEKFVTMGNKNLNPYLSQKQLF